MTNSHSIVPDIPVNLLQNQANVLARMSAFVVVDADGRPKKEDISNLFSALIHQL